MKGAIPSPVGFDRGRRLWLVAALLALVVSCSSSGSESSDTSRPAAVDEGDQVRVDPLPPGREASIGRVVDGDTVELANDETVRLIGLDTPETKHPSVGVECYGREASAFTERLLPAGTAVRLVEDVESVDRYGRTLAYVYRVDDGVFVNAELLAQGYAQVATFPPNVRHVDEFLAHQREAREAERGLWTACPESAQDVEGDADEPLVAPVGDCDGSYPGLCLPSAPPDLDCDDVGATNIRVLPPDPHGLDGDGDGVGCAA